MTYLTNSTGATYPVLAFVFARVLDVFQIPSTSEMVSKGDFYALMFFVIALVILVVYGVLGWVTNVISNVSLSRGVAR
jgi:ATP-binding cassette subfamily B (MDR/TAP) protein 1